MKKSIIASTLLVTIFSASMNAMDEEKAQKIEFFKKNAPQGYELFKACAWEYKPHILVGIYAAAKDSPDMKEWQQKDFAHTTDLLKGIINKRPVPPLKVKFGATNCFGDYAKISEYDGVDRSGNIYMKTEDGTQFYFPGSFDKNQEKYPKMDNTPLIVFEFE